MVPNPTILLLFSVVFGYLTCSLASSDPEASPSLTTIFVPLTLNEALRYTIEVNMSTGHPNSQSFALEMSTGTGYTMVPGLNCTTCGGIPEYNLSESSTATSLASSANISTLTGFNDGNLIKEDCSFLQQNGSAWIYNNQTILVVNQTSAPTPSTGVVGLGRNANSSFNVTVFSSYLAANPSRNNLTWGMALNSPYSSSSDGGVLHWIQPEQSFYKNDLTTKNATSIPTLTDWAVTLDAWSLATSSTNISHTAADTLAAIEPYYPNIYIPQETSKAIFDSIPGAKIQPPSATNPAFAQFWQIPCSTQISFSVTLGDQIITLDESVLVFTQGTECFCAIQGWSDSTVSYFLLGSTFISAIYVIFTASETAASIGFALRASSSHQLSAGDIAGIVLGSISVAGFIITFLVFFGLKLYRRGRQQGVQEERSKQSLFSSQATIASPTAHLMQQNSPNRTTPTSSPNTPTFDIINAHYSTTSYGGHTPSSPGAQTVFVPQDSSPSLRGPLPPLPPPPIRPRRRQDIKHRGVVPGAQSRYVSPNTPPSPPPHGAGSFLDFDESRHPPPEYAES